MSGQQLAQLKEEILGGKKGSKLESVDSIVAVIRELSCLPEIIGRTYDVFDPKGKLVFTIKQRPMTINRMKTLYDSLVRLSDEEKRRAEETSKGK